MPCYANTFLPLKIIESMYKSLIEPYYRCCIPVWGCCSTTTLDQLQRLQNRAARMVTNSRYGAPSLPLIKGSGWFTIMELIEIETAKMVLKFLYDSVPIYIAQIIKRLSDKSVRQLRRTQTDLNVPKIKSIRGQNCFSYKGANLWNNFDGKTKMSYSLSSFIKSISDLDYNNSPYPYSLPSCKFSNVFLFVISLCLLLVFILIEFFCFSIFMQGSF